MKNHPEHPEVRDSIKAGLEHGRRTGRRTRGSRNILSTALVRTV